MEIHSHSRGHLTSSRGIATAFWLNLFFSLFALLGGLFARSASLTAEGIHCFGDSFSVGIAWLLERLSKHKRDLRYTYGYRRYSLLAALLISLLLIAISIGMLITALDHFFDWGIELFHIHSHGEPHAGSMLIVAFVGLLVKSIAVLRLRKGKSLNEKAVMYHMLMDSLSWAVIFISSGVIYFFAVPLLDKLLTFFIALWILYHMIPTLLRTFAILLQAVPKGIDITEVKEKIVALEGIKQIEQFRFWSLDGESNIMTLKLQVEDSFLTNKEKRIALYEAIRQIGKSVKVEECTIEIE